MIILNQLGPDVDAILAAHASRPRVLQADRDTEPWETRDAEVLLTGPSTAWMTAPKSAPPLWPGRLRWVQVASTGVDWFPPWLFHGPVVTCGRGHAAAAIAEYVLTAILLHEKRLDRIVATGLSTWRRHELGTLEGATLGIAGYGAIGQAVAVRAAAFGMRILALRRTSQPAFASADTHAPDVELVPDLQTLVARSDHLVLALPLTGATRHIVDAGLLAHARPGLHLINIARGGLIDQDALLASLDRGHLGFASLDVTEPEPLPDGHPFYHHDRVRLTPHVSWSGGGHQDRLNRQIAANLDRYLTGDRLQDIVDPERGY